MAMRLSLVKFSPAATKGLVEQGFVARADYLRKTLDTVDVQLLGYYWVEGGEWDAAFLLEGPDDMMGVQNLAASLMSQGTGIWDRTVSFVLHTPQEMDAAMAQAFQLTMPGGSE